MATSSVDTELTPRGVGLDLGRVIIFAAVIAGLSYVTFPYPPSPGIPIDFQVVGVFLAAILMGPARGAAAATLFLVAGLAGLPVFDGGGGLATLLVSPKVGYYLAYPLAAVLVGYLVHGGTHTHDVETIRPRRLFGAMLAGIVILTAGFTGGYAIVMDTGPVVAFMLAALPFVPGDLIKVVVVIGVARHDLLAAE